MKLNCKQKTLQVTKGSKYGVELELDWKHNMNIFEKFEYVKNKRSQSTLLVFHPSSITTQRAPRKFCPARL